MITLKELQDELNQESVTTRKFLERIPSDKYDWRPHEKSMSIKQLSGHIAELPSWVTLAFETEELDFQKSDYKPSEFANNEELLSILEKGLTVANASLENAEEEDLLPQWQFKNGDDILADLTKGKLVRFAISQTIHHRAQLGVYLRLLNIPIPGSYGPSADEPSF